MRHQIDVVRLRHRRHLDRLGQSPNVAHVDARKLRNAPLDIRQELPLAGKLLSNRKRDVGHAP